MSEGPCPNCGEPGLGRYCSACGRRRTTTTASFRDLLQEGVDELLGIERRFFRTVWQLARRPGFLTQEYREGHGARYVSPIRLLLLSGAAWVATASWRGAVPVSLGDVGVSYPTVTLVAMPLFAVALFVGYYTPGRTYTEYLIFALYFQAAQLLFSAISTPLPPNARVLLTVLVASYYLAAGTRRLWGEHGIKSWLKAVFAWLLYGLSVLIALALLSLTVGRAL